MFITINWYTDKVRTTIVSDPDDALTLVSILDANTSVRQWNCDLIPMEYPWYQKHLWKKLIYCAANWDYRS